MQIHVVLALGFESILLHFALYLPLTMLDDELKSVKNENNMLQEKLKLTNDIAKNYDEEIQVMLQENQEKMAAVSPKRQKSYNVTQL